MTFTPYVLLWLSNKIFMFSWEGGGGEWGKCRGWIERQVKASLEIMNEIVLHPAAAIILQ